VQPIAIAGFPWPIREADLMANNEYLAEMAKAGKLSPFMCVMPDWDSEDIEKTLSPLTTFPPRIYCSGRTCL